MKIFVISMAHPVNDKRVTRSIRILQNFGEVFHQFSGKCDKSYPKNLICIPYPKKSLDPISWFLKWKKFEIKILDMVKNTQPDLIYVHGFPFFLKKLPEILKNISKKVIYDLHENYPYQFMSNSRFHKFMRKFAVKRLGEIISNADGLVFVSSESAAIMMTLVEKVKPYFILPNLPLYCKKIKSYEIREKTILILGRTSIGEENFAFIYKTLNRRGYILKIIGRNMELPGIIAKSLGFLSYDAMMDEVSNSFATFIPFGGNEIGNLIPSFPNRYFDSLGAGTPVIVDYRNLTMARYTLNNGVGVVVNTNSEKDLIEKFSYLENNYSYILENIKELHCWENILKDYENFLKRIIKANES